MHYMYHHVPYNMVGTVLYPLNELRYVDTRTYVSQRAKYLFNPDQKLPDRLRLMYRSIPILKCRWNDVLHSSTVHPRDLMHAWVAAGYHVSEERFFEIPIDMLDLSSVVIYKHQRKWFKHMRWNYERYDPHTYQEYTRITEKAKREMIGFGKRKERQWRYIHVPHVLYRGKIETKGLNIVTVSP